MEGLAWRSPLGVGVFQQGLPDYMTPEQLDEQVGTVVDRLEEVGYSRSKMLSCLAAGTHPNVWFVPKAFRCNDWTDQKCNGVQQVSTIIIAAMPCRYHTALMHEFGHYFQMCADGGTYDPDHTQTWVWEAADIVIRECKDDELYVPDSKLADINQVSTKLSGGVQ